jgi:hypothetical protein
VLAIVGSECLPRVVLDDHVLTHVVDALNRLAAADLTKVFERISAGELRCLNPDPFVHDRKALTKRALLCASLGDRGGAG